MVAANGPERPERAMGVEGHMAYSVYILQCADGTYYVGSADNVAERVKRHNAGDGAEYTARRRPVVLMHSECLSNKAAAVQRERQIKRWSRAKKEALIAGDKNQLRELSRRRT